MRVGVFVMGLVVLHAVVVAQSVSPRPGTTRVLGGITFVAIPAG